MWAAVKIKTPCAVPLTVELLADMLRLDVDDENDLLRQYLSAAASEIEGPDGWGVALGAQVWTLTLNRLPEQIILPGWPVTGVSQIRYMDRTGAVQVLDHAAHYRLVRGLDPARLVRTSGAALPFVLPEVGAVEVDYNLGHADPADVDPALMTALGMLAGHFFENREATTAAKLAEVPLGVSHIRNRFARVEFG